MTKKGKAELLMPTERRGVMARKPTTRRTKAASVASAYAGRQQSCATPSCTNLASACCLGYCWTCSARREANRRGRS